MTPISICIIGCDEEAYLDRLFSSIDKCFGDYPKEVVFVDTGSEDGTPDKAKAYADVFVNYPWTGDFAAARNFAMKSATNDSILFLDCDEEIEELNLEDLGSTLEDCADTIGMVRLKNMYTLLGAAEYFNEKRARIVNRTVHRFEGAIGERIVPINDGIPCNYIDVDMTLTHYGYLNNDEGALLRVERTLPLLINAVEKSDVVKDAALYFMLGQHYNLIGEDKKAAEYMRKGMEENEAEGDDSELLMALGFGYTLLHMNNHTQAIELVALSDKYKDSADFLCLMGIIYLRNGMIDNAFNAFKEAMEAKDVIVEGARFRIPAFNMGCIHELYGETDEAIDLYKKCGDYYPAKERLEQLL